MLNSEYNILFASLSSFLITYLAIPKIIYFGKLFGLSDVAGIRASHSGSVPIFGGVAIFSGILFSILLCTDLASIQFILVSFLILFFVGIIDDVLALTPFRKLIGQIIAILIVIYLGEIQIDSMHGVLGVYKLPDWLATFFTVFVVIVITNGFNLIDGVDGLAAGIGVISSFGFGLIAYFMNQMEFAIIAFSLFGALLAFLKFNFNPAQIFMGDTGSLLVGMVLSVLAINLIKSGLVTESIHLPHKGPLLAIVLLAIPLFDSLRVFVVRTSKGQGPLLPARDHIHHALLDLGFGHRKTALALYILSLSLIVFSYFLLEFDQNLSIALLAIFSYIILIIPFYILRKRKK